jgi:hypothetical protein
MSSAELIEALKRFVSLDIGNERTIGNCKRLLNQISLHQVYEGNEYLLGLEQLAGELRDDLSQRYFEQFIKNANDILLIEGQSRSIPWTDAENLVRKQLADAEILELKQWPDVERQIKTAEWVWQNSLKTLVDNAFDADRGQDLTFAVASYIKLVELFLCHKLGEALNGRKVTLPNENEVIVGSVEYYEEATAGTYIKLLKAERTLKKRRDVIDHLHDWLSNVRNAHFHKDAVVELEKARDIREKTILLIRELVEALNQG